MNKIWNYKICFYSVDYHLQAMGLFYRKDMCLYKKRES